MSVPPKRTSSDVTGRSQKTYPTAVVSAVKHDYVAKGLFSHHRFDPVVVTDQVDQPDWVHERNERLAAELSIPYLPGLDDAFNRYGPEVAVVSPEAERHASLSLSCIDRGLHVVQDKPMATAVSDCDAIVDAVQRRGVRFLLWNRNFLPAVRQARQVVESRTLGPLRAIHIDFYFAKDAGIPVGSRPVGDPLLDWLEALKAAHATGADGGVGRRPMGELEVEGIYPLAYMNYLTHSAVLRVFARTTAHFHQLHLDNQVDDLATVTMLLEGNITGTLCLGRIGNASHPDIGEIKLHLIGEQQSMIVSEPRPEVGVFYRGQSEMEFPNRRVANYNDWLLAEDMARAIDNKTSTVLDALAGRNIAATVYSCIESGRSGRAVDVNYRRG